MSDPKRWAEEPEALTPVERRAFAAGRRRQDAPRAVRKALWDGLAAGIPYKAAAVVATWTDLYSALWPQDVANRTAAIRARSEPRPEEARISRADLRAGPATIPARRSPTREIRGRPQRSGPNRHQALGIRH